MTVPKSEFDRAFDDVFLKFISSGMSQGKSVSDNFDLSAMNATTDEDMIALTTCLTNQIRPEPFSAMQADLARAVRTSVAEYDDIGFHSMVERHLSVAAMETLSGDASSDFIYTKINHGFWEQLYSIFSDEIDPQRMRIVSREPHMRRYVKSAFLVPLAHLIAQAGQEHNGKVTFDPLHFALSLGNGTMTHQESLDQFDGLKDHGKRVMSGAAIGAAAFFDTVFPGKEIHAVDGCFPKRGLSNNLLESTLREKLPGTDRIIFAVPNHLDGICLTISDLPQEQILVSGSHVHEAWLGTLYKCGRQIMGRLWHGEGVLVITQSGVFSALLGLFLAHAKQRLGITDKRLFYFDLGQVTDTANPKASGPWVRKYAPETGGLFKIPEPA